MTSPAPVPTPTLWKKGEALYSLTNNKFASVTRCQTLVHIRQYTETDTGDLKSTRRGFTLLPEEFNQLLSINIAILRDVFAVTPVSDQQWQQEEQQQETPQQPDTRQMVPPTPTPSPLMQRRETTTMTKPPKKRLRLHIPAIATTTAPPAATEGQEICLPDIQPQLYAQHIDTIVNQLLNGDETMSGYGQTEQCR
ncbi:hypothetical protein BaRGS_00008123 [Batillaria attramentaria]|uniref:Transcriptional coactivator p15 (PC4) C-terminal domain-containing protein n=1 Tax=Batillaria attramentaria TaxID=370345 RepID=A0ABD0LMX4_9CAEN